MSCFADADDLYDTLGRLFVEALDDERLGPLFARANTVIRWNYTDPDAEITLSLADGEPAVVEFGASQTPAEVTMTMDADIAHRFWLGELNVGVALTRGQIVATGPVEKILRLVPLATSVFPRYRRLLVNTGRPVEIALAPGVQAV